MCPISQREEKLLEDLNALVTLIKDTDGIKKILDAVDISDKAARLLGQVDISDEKDREAGRTAPSLKTAIDKTVTRDADGRIEKAVFTDGVTTKTADVTRDAQGKIEKIDESIT